MTQDTGVSVHPIAVCPQESHYFSLISPEQALTGSSLGARPMLGSERELKSTVPAYGTEAERSQYCWRQDFDLTVDSVTRLTAKSCPLAAPPPGCLLWGQCSHLGNLRSLDLDKRGRKPPGGGLGGPFRQRILG